MTEKDPINTDQKNIDIIALLFQIWKDKWYIIGLIFIFFIISVYQLQNSSFKYDVTLKVSPARQISSSQASTNLTGLASIIGISTPKSSDVNYYNLYKTLFKSRIISEQLLKDKEFIKLYSKSENLNISSKLFETGKLTILDNSWRSKIKGFLGLPSHSRTISLENIIHTKFLAPISINTNKLTNITTISLKAVNPDLGIELLKKIHLISDKTLKNRTLKRTEDYILFLNSQLSKTTKQDQRLSLISTLAEQQRSKMIASSNLSFAAELFGKPFHSSAPTTPRIRNVVFAFSVVGFFTGLVFSIFRYFMKTNKL